MPDIDRELAAVAARQHSLITLRDVRAAGGTKQNAAARTDAGRWESVFNEVYRIAGVPWTYEARVLALILAAGDGACASHLCALRLLGLGFRTARPEISVPRGRNFRPEKVLVRTTTDLDRCRIVVRNAIPMTDPARSLLDSARFLRGVALRNVVEEARRQDLATWHDLIQCVAVHARPGRHGVRRLRDVIAAGVPTDEITDTDSELAALGLLLDYGFGEPTLQKRIFDADGRLVTTMDFAYEPILLNIEIDGSVHLEPRVQLKDAARDTELRTTFGWTVRRIWWEVPVRRPRLFVAMVREAVDEATLRAGSRGLVSSGQGLLD